MPLADNFRVLSQSEESEFNRRIREAGRLTIKAFLIRQERAALIKPKNF